MECGQIAELVVAVGTWAEINERAPDFFEDLGMLVHRDYIDREMVWDTFSYYAIRWWGAC